MNNEEHMLLGGLLGFGGYLFYRLINQEPVNLLEAILSSIGGAFVGILPDILEPAINPNHRSLFHSVALLLMLVNGNSTIWQNENLTKDQKAAISLLSAAYGSHLATDGMTKKGLPLLL